MVSLVATSPLTEAIHGETSDPSTAVHSLLHAELSQGQFEVTQLRATAGSTCLSVTHCWSPAEAESKEGDIWNHGPVPSLHP